MEEAIQAYHIREMERLRSKARHDEAQAIWNAERKAERRNTMTIAKNLLRVGDSIDKIITVTGLTREEIQSLRDAD